MKVHGKTCGLYVLALASTLVVGCAAHQDAVTLETPAERPSTIPSMQSEPPPPGGFTIEESVLVTPVVRADYQAAVQILEEGRYEMGILLLLDVIERAPEATAAYIALGIAYMRIDNLDQAEVNLHKALQLNPQHPAALNELGLVQRRKGKFAESRTSYEAALAQFDDFHFAHRNLAILCDLYSGDTACALEHYEAYHRIVPDDGEVVKWIADLRNRANLQETP